MTSLRKVVILVFLAVFVAAFVLAVLGSMKKIDLADGALTGFFTVLVVQGIAAIVAAFRTPDFFKEEHKTIAGLEQRHREEIAKLQVAHKAALDELSAEIIKWKQTAFKMQSQPRQVPPSIIAPGSERTRERP